MLWRHTMDGCVTLDGCVTYIFLAKVKQTVKQASIKTVTHMEMCDDMEISWKAIDIFN